MEAKQSLYKYLLTSFNDGQHPGASLIDIYRYDREYYEEIKLKGGIRDDAKLFFRTTGERIDSINSKLNDVKENVEYYNLISEFLKDHPKYKVHQNTSFRTPAKHIVCCPKDYEFLEVLENKPITFPKEFNKLQNKLLTCPKCKGIYTYTTELPDLCGIKCKMGYKVQMNKYDKYDYQVINISPMENTRRVIEYLKMRFIKNSDNKCYVHIQESPTHCKLCGKQLRGRKIFSNLDQSDYQFYNSKYCPSCDMYHVHLNDAI